MAHLDLDLTIPIALLMSAIAGVMLVKYVIGRGDALAKERTRRLLREHGMANVERSPAAA